MSESQTGRAIEAVVFDVGRVLYRWDLRILFEQLIEDEKRLEFLLSEVVTEQWHFQHDAGRPLGDMVPERQAQFPDYADALDAYRTRFNETIPGPVPGFWGTFCHFAESNPGFIEIRIGFRVLSQLNAFRGPFPDFGPRFAILREAIRVAS